jgi:hypothetical protein
MSNHFSMGAINKVTQEYEYPKIAIRGNKYKCPSCEKDVIFKHGKIKQPHFAHYKSYNPCYYYDKPSESQIHKDAKMLMKKLLDEKHNIFIERKCNYCEKYGICNESDDYDIFSHEYNDNTKAIIEYKFKYNDSNKSADVALVENDKIKYIFEICYKNKTYENNRPEPWFEIKAEDLLNKINSGEIIDEEGNISLECIRHHKCEVCEWHEKEIREKQQQYEYYMMEKKRKEYERIKKEMEEDEISKKKEYERMKKEKEEYWITKKKEEEQEKLRNAEEARKRVTHPCGIMVMNICECDKPQYELVKLSNNLFCNNCLKWKCRC